MRPDYAEALCNRGVTLHEMRRFDEALASYAGGAGRCGRIMPRRTSTKACAGRCSATMSAACKSSNGGGTPSKASNRRNFRQPLWLGADDIAGKTILLHAEQGFGDTIQFCRYVPLVAARGARVVLEVQRPLRRLMDGLSRGADAHGIVARGEPLPAFDLHCPLLSLPLAFGTRLETIPSATPYLRAAAQDRWRIGNSGSGPGAAPKDRTCLVRRPDAAPSIDETQGVVAAA